MEYNTRSTNECPMIMGLLWVYSLRHKTSVTPKLVATQHTNCRHRPQTASTAWNNLYTIAESKIGDVADFGPLDLT